MDSPKIEVSVDLLRSLYVSLFGAAANIADSYGWIDVFLMQDLDHLWQLLDGPEGYRDGLRPPEEWWKVAE